MNNAPPAILDSQNACSPLSIPFSRTALLLLDFHRFIVASQPGEGLSVLSSAEALRSWARSHSILIIHCLIDLKAYTAEIRKMSSRANSVRQKMSTASPESMGEPAAIAAMADEYVFWRPPSHVSAMGSYGLDTFLAEHGVQSLILTGFSTSGCVVNTAKGAADKGFVVTVVKDACGDKDEEVQRVMMQKMLVGQCHVVDKDELVKVWKIENQKRGSIEETTEKLEIKG